MNDTNLEKEKKNLRKSLILKRKSIDKNQKNEKDLIIFEKIINLDVYQNSDLILTYVSFQDEVDTLKLIDYSLKIGKTVVVPKCKSNSIMNFYKIKTIGELKKSNYGILEPEEIQENLVDLNQKAICIVPALSFDRKLNRIGYGGGYYDNFIKKNHNIIYMGLCYDFMISEELPTENHDEKVNYLITEKNNYLGGSNE